MKAICEATEEDRAATSTKQHSNEPPINFLFITITSINRQPTSSP
jgi:hypothetical protein